MIIMQDYNTIVGVIQMRLNDCQFSVIESRYHIGSGTVQRILERFDSSGFSLEQLKTMEPSKVEELIYPPANLQRKDREQGKYFLLLDRVQTGTS